MICRKCVEMQPCRQPNAAEVAAATDIADGLGFMTAHPECSRPDLRATRSRYRKRFRGTAGAEGAPIEALE